MEQAIRESEQKALQANMAKSQFLANMSHEIRTPMAAVLGYADVLLDHLCDADNRNCVLIIKRNGEHLLNIINDILDLSRVEAGKVEPDLAICHIPQMLADIRSLMQVRADEKQLQLVMRSDGSIPEQMMTDGTRVRQVLINLLGNAIKFTNEGRVTCVVRHRSEDASETIEFEVADTGIGINSEQQSRLFQPFSQGDNSVTRAYGGSGLGLAISQRFVEMLNGQITFVSEPGTGSTFIVRLPCQTPSDTKLVELSPNRDAQSLSPEHVRRRLTCRVLVVDDRREVRYISQHFLESSGAKVTTAEDGHSGIQAVYRAAAAGTPFDIIIMDMQMPNVDGRQATAILRAAGIQQPIIALTADAMKGDRELCIQAGCDDYLSKPIDHNSFVAMVARYTQDLDLEQLEQIRQARHMLAQASTAS